MKKIIMNTPRILIIGTGSIGIRHLEILLAFGVDVATVSHRPEQCAYIHSTYNIPAFCSLKEAVSFSPNTVVIANRTDLHIETALECAKLGYHIFIEKPLSHTKDGINSLNNIIKEKKIVAQIGCVLRFHSVVKKVLSLLQEQPFGKPVSGRFWCGSDLSQWRKNQDYRQNYTAKSEYGGGVTLDLIHEIDLSLVFFGYPDSVLGNIGHISYLETQTEDTSQILLQYDNKSMVQIHLDYHRSTPIRGFDITTENGCILADLITNEIQYALRKQDMKTDRILVSNKNEMYQKQMQAFLDAVMNRHTTTLCNFNEGVQTLEIALKAKHSSASRHWETVENFV